MSRAFEAAMKRSAAVERGEEPTPEPAKPKVVKAGIPLSEKTLARKITDSSLYDGHPAARFLLDREADPNIMTRASSWFLPSM